MKNVLLLILTLSLTLNSFSQINFDSLLIGYWPFNGNTLDESSFSNNAVNFSCLLSSDHSSSINSAFGFNGSNSYMEIPSSYSTLNLPFSISVWALKTQLVGYEHIFTSSSAVNQYSGIYLGVNPAGNVQISYSDGGPLGSFSRRSFATISTFPLNEWVHISAVVNGQNDMVIQFNCVEQEGTYSGSGGNLVHGLNNALIGSAAHNPNYWSGKLDNIRLYNRALTSDELFAICRIEEYLTDSEVFSSNDFLIYPNPSSDYINIKNLSSFNSYQMFDLRGRLIVSDNIFDFDSKLDISFLAKGNYILSLSGNAGVVNKKFIVE